MTESKQGFTTLNNGSRVVPCAVLSDPDASGVVTVHAAEGGEGDGNSVKAFAARKVEGQDYDYDRAYS